MSRRSSRRETDDKKVKAVRSDTPTVAIAPSDYQHIYAAGGTNPPAPQRTSSTPARSPSARSQGVKTVKSDTPTVAIAPSDYQHIYAAEGKSAAPKPKVDTRGKPLSQGAGGGGGGGGGAVKAVKSDTPTVAIAPSDYQHIYQAEGKSAVPKPKVDTRGTPVSQGADRGGGGAVKAVKSDTPTVAIAPSDYQHIYQAEGKSAVPKPKVDTRGSPISQGTGGPVKTVKSDTPTVAIAPSDYQHIYQAEGKTTAAKPKVDTRGTPMGQPSATPTAAIAPSDYQHIYANKPSAPAKKASETPRDAETQVESEARAESSAPPPPTAQEIQGQNFYGEDFGAEQGYETPAPAPRAPRIEAEVHQNPRSSRRHKSAQEGISPEVIAMVVAFINRQPKRYVLKRERSSSRN